MQKIDMSITIVSMINNTAIKGDRVEVHLENHLFSNESNMTCKLKPPNATHADGPFVWTKGTQGFILSSYFYGYIMTQVLSAWLSLRFGGKIVLAMSMFLGEL